MSGGPMADRAGAVPTDGASGEDVAGGDVPGQDGGAGPAVPGRATPRPGVSADGTWRPAPPEAAAPPVPAQASRDPLTAVPPQRPAPAAPFPAVPPPDPTGEERVDAALGRLADLAGAPVSGHVEIFEDVHHRLQDILTSADQESAGPAAPRPGPPRPGGRP